MLQMPVGKPKRQISSFLQANKMVTVSQTRCLSEEVFFVKTNMWHQNTALYLFYSRIALHIFMSVNVFRLLLLFHIHVNR